MARTTTTTIAAAAVLHAYIYDALYLMHFNSFAVVVVCAFGPQSLAIFCCSPFLMQTQPNGPKYFRMNFRTALLLDVLSIIIILGFSIQSVRCDSGCGVVDDLNFIFELMMYIRSKYKCVIYILDVHSFPMRMHHSQRAMRHFDWMRMTDYAQQTKFLLTPSQSHCK